MTADDLSPIKRALVEQRRLKARIAELEARRPEPVAVIGIGCRFPGGADSAEAFWTLLETGVDAIRELPPERFDVHSFYDPDPEAPGKSATRFGGFLTQVDQFDAHYFGISPREAVSMDPQQRLLLEVTWEALEHAGCAPDRVVGSATGVFVGIGTNDYLQQLIQQAPLDGIDAYLATGNAHSVASGRLAYLLGTHGPTLSVDTACSSSLVAVHLACESIRTGRCEAAVAGGVGILLSPENYVSLSKARMMAPDGRCKAFDAAADGFVRAEGCGMVVLKRLSAARAAGDRILAVIHGTACNQDGRSNGITAPNGPAQQAVLRSALADAAIAPRDIGYVEAHGTGTALGDPIEVEALAAVLSEDRPTGAELHLGSVKSNLGHLEAAAGVAGLIKAVLAIHHRKIPATLHYRIPNPHIEWSRYPFLRVAGAPVRWDATRRLAGVSAFGFSGTNAHVVLGNAEPETGSLPVNAEERPLQLLAVSARTPAMLRQAAAHLATHLHRQADAGQAGQGTALADWCYSINTARPTHAERRGFLAANAGEMRAQLDAFVGGQSVETSYEPSARAMPGATPGVLFGFPATPPDATQIAALSRAEPGFHAAWTATHALHGRWPAFAAGVALAELWAGWGVRPAAVTGAAEGLLAAAVVAGAVRREEVLQRLAEDRYGGWTLTDPLIPVYCAVRGHRLGRDELARRLESVMTAGSAGALPGVIAGFDVVLDLGTVEHKPMLHQLKDLYEAGYPVDWRGFDAGRGRRRVDVPFSPYDRRRYWFDRSSNGAWERLTTAALEQSRQFPAGVEPATFTHLWRELDALTTHAVAHALGQLGAFAQAGDTATADAAFRMAKMLPMYRTLFGQWLDRLCSAGLLERQGDAFKSSSGLRTLPPRPPLTHLARWPVFAAYLGRAEQSLAVIAAGKSSPLQVLFPEGSHEAPDFFYREWELARYFNAIVAAVTAAVAQTAGGRRLRILEIGAGTGGTTEAVLPVLRDVAEEYWFTDLSDHFFSRAEERYAQSPFLRCARFDLDADPDVQAIPTGHFDLVIAANSVHATRDIGLAIERARSLLVPGGTLILYEVTRDFEWFEMSWALVEGWQRHADALRPMSPLLPPERWREQLGTAGFARCEIFPRPGDAAEVLGHHVILAQLDATPGRAAPTPSAIRSVPAAPRVATVAEAASAATDWRAYLLPLTQGERQQRLQDLVRQHVVRVMRLEGADNAPGINERLMNAGVDSLMAVELRNALRREFGAAAKIPATLIFDHPTIVSIAALLQSLLDLDGPVAEVDAPARLPMAAAPVSTDAGVLAAMSEDDAEALLLEKLKVLT